MFLFSLNIINIILIEFSKLRINFLLKLNLDRKTAFVGLARGGVLF